MREILLYFALKYEGDFKKIYRALEHHEKVEPETKKKLISKVKSNFVTIIDENYPQKLKNIDCPPFVLFYHGDLNLLDRNTIAVIGMRQPSGYGALAASHFTAKLVEEGWTIVSGMARGIDTIAHSQTIKSQGRTIAVLGSGINCPYPKSNGQLYQNLKESQLVISEYPDLTKPLAINFPKRNRIIAGLADKILVVEAKVRSGTMITVGYGLDQGKDIYAIPGRFNDNSGTNRLIQQGAGLVVEVRDLVG